MGEGGEDGGRRAGGTAGPPQAGTPRRGRLRSWTSILAAPVVNPLPADVAAAVHAVVEEAERRVASVEGGVRRPSRLSPLRRLLEARPFALDHVRQLRGREVTSSDSTHEIRLLGEDTGSLTSLYLQDTDGQPEDLADKADRLEQVRIVRDHDRHFVPAGEAVDEEVRRQVDV